MKCFLLFCLYFTCFFASSQFQFDWKQFEPKEAYDHIYVKEITSDSLASSFLIWIKDTVKTHKHAYHTETIYVIQGEGTFYFNDTLQPIQTGSIITISKGNWHAVKVTSTIPMVVLSVQAPYFDGKDRIFKTSQ